MSDVSAGQHLKTGGETRIANADLDTKLNHVVKVTGADKKIDVAGGRADHADGVAVSYADDGKTGDSFQIAVEGDLVRIKAGNTVTRGTYQMIDTGNPGQIKDLATGQGVGDTSVVAYALESGSAGDFPLCRVTNFIKHMTS